MLHGVTYSLKYFTLYFVTMCSRILNFEAFEVWYVSLPDGCQVNYQHLFSSLITGTFRILAILVKMAQSDIHQKILRRTDPLVIYR